MSTTGATFFELVKNNEWNVKQFLDEYAIDDKYIYKQNSSGNYEKDTSFNVFSSNANGISKVLTIDGRDAYVIYGNSNETCIQAVIINGDGSRSILKY